MFVTVLVGALLVWAKLGHTLTAKLEDGENRLAGTLDDALYRGQQREHGEPQFTTHAASSGATAASINPSARATNSASNTEQPVARGSESPSYWRQAKDYVRESTPAQIALGMAFFQGERVLVDGKPVFVKYTTQGP